MIEYPINVQPQNIAIDATVHNPISFTFQGDRLAETWYRIYDYDTGALVWNVRAGSVTGIYNGYNVAKNLNANSLTNNKHYVMTMQLIQKTADGTDFINDMYVCGGKVEGAESRTVIYIAADIETIYPLNSFQGEYFRASVNDVPIDNMAIKINGESHNILSYKAEVEVGGKIYGRIIVDSAFSFDVTSDMNYYVYSSFIITPQYYFETIATPTMTLSYDLHDNRIVCMGDYTQSQNEMIKHFNLKLHWSDTQITESAYNLWEQTELVGESGKIYSQLIEYTFWDSYRHNKTVKTSDYYRIECEITTQNGMTLTAWSNIIECPVLDRTQGSVPLIDTVLEYTSKYDKDTGFIYHKIKIYDFIDGHFELIREDLDTGEETYLYPNFYIGGFVEEVSEYEGYDATASTHGNYKYTLLCFDSDGKARVFQKGEQFVQEDIFPSTDIETHELAYYITELNLQDNPDLIYHPNHANNRKPQFKTGDTWKFYGEISNTTITNNLDRTIHTGYSQYSSVTSTDVNYLSGSLSAMLGHLDCATKEFVDNISMVKAWRRFITQQKPFMLKTQKGDVLIVNVSNPNTEYDEGQRDILTRLNFDWHECMDIKDVDIRKG